MEEHKNIRGREDFIEQSSATINSDEYTIRKKPRMVEAPASEASSATSEATQLSDGHGGQQQQHEEEEEEEEEERPACCVCAGIFSASGLVSCAAAERPHTICCKCLTSMETNVPPTFELKCPCCRQPFDADLFARITIAQQHAPLAPEELLARMRDESLNVKMVISEYNFLAYALALLRISETDVDDVEKWLPHCVKAYLSRVTEGKRARWLEAFRTCARSMHFDLFNSEAAREGAQLNGFRTTYPCQDAIIFIIYLLSESVLNPVNLMYPIFTFKQIESFDRKDPPEDHSGYESDSDGNESITDFTNAIAGIADDFDIDFIFEMEDSFIQVMNSDGEFGYFYVDQKGFQRSYSGFMRVKQMMDMVHMHPDVWFISCCNPD